MAQYFECVINGLSNYYQSIANFQSPPDFVERHMLIAGKFIRHIDLEGGSAQYAENFQLNPVQHRRHPNPESD